MVPIKYPPMAIARTTKGQSQCNAAPVLCLLDRRAAERVITRPGVVSERTATVCSNAARTSAEEEEEQSKTRG